MSAIDEDKMREVLANQRKCYLVDVINENIYGLAMANISGVSKSLKKDKVEQILYYLSLLSVTNLNHFEMDELNKSMAFYVFLRDLYSDNLSTKEIEERVRRFSDIGKLAISQKIVWPYTEETIKEYERRILERYDNENKEEL